VALKRLQYQYSEICARVPGYTFSVLIDLFIIRYGNPVRVFPFTVVYSSISNLLVL